MADLNDKLKVVRKFTGKRFAASKGYDARKPMSKARARTIAKYYDLITELTGRPHKIITPKRGEKREAFSFTGQTRYPRFDKAIVVIPDADSPYSYSIDKTRPKGSRFVLYNKRTRERSWHIPAEVFLDENELLYDPDQDIDPEFFESVLEEYAEQGPNNVYMIEAGDYHMWGSAGSIPQVAGKLGELFKNYGADIFDATDRNSHFIGNWFRGVQVFGQADAMVYRTERAEAETKRIREFNQRAGANVMRYGQRFRLLPSGDMGEFVFGKLVRVHPTGAPSTPTRDGKFKVKRVVGKPRKPRT